MVITSIILSITAILCGFIELVYVIIQKRRIRRVMKLHFNAVYDNHSK